MKKTAKGFRAKAHKPGFRTRYKAGAGPKSWRTSIGKGTNAWSSTRRPRSGRRKKVL